jgi:hypothetical protein
MIEYNEFKENCNKKFCLRKTFISNNCLKESKQKKCFEKYIEKISRDFKIDDKWKEVQKQVWKRDRGECQVEKILSTELINIIRKQFFILYTKYDGKLDCMHIIPRSIAPHLVYDVDNIILGGRFYHSFIDKNLDFTTGKYEKDFRERMFNRIMHETGRWGKEYCYEDFKGDKCK